MLSFHQRVATRFSTTRSVRSNVAAVWILPLTHERSRRSADARHLSHIARADRLVAAPVDECVLSHALLGRAPSSSLIAIAASSIFANSSFWQ